MTEKLVVGGLTFEVRRSPRRKTIGLTVDRGGELLIYAPEGTAKAELSEWAQGKLLWVHQKLIRKGELTGRFREPEYVSGESFSYFGKTFRLAVVNRQDLPLDFDGRRFRLRRDAIATAHLHFRQWYIATGSNWLRQRVATLARRVSVVPQSIGLRDLGYRWGSCGKGGALYFNWRLLQLPVRLIDYVILHELVHILEPNHGRAFQALLDRSMPDWREREAQLRAQAQEIFWCHESMSH